jgi:hypothetical protein
MKYSKVGCVWTLHTVATKSPTGEVSQQFPNKGILKKKFKIKKIQLALSLPPFCRLLFERNQLYFGAIFWLFHIFFRQSQHKFRVGAKN